MKKVAVINDISGFGRCSMAVQLPILSTMQVMACPMPTGVFSCQSAFDSYHYTDLTEQMLITLDDWLKTDVKMDAIIAGFMMSANQLQVVQKCIKSLKKENSIILIDPILGDDGIQFSFFNTEYLNKMQELIKEATIITPNITELCLLCNYDYNKLTNQEHKPTKEYINEIQKIARPLFNENLEQIIVTGVKQINNNKNTEVHNVLITKNGSTYSTASEFLMGSFSGTGDILASMICGYLLRGTKIETAINRTSDFLNKVVNASINSDIDRKFGADFESVLNQIEI